ncbi:TonB-dependent receptor plug domain-containing protein [Arenicella xantha]|uniref:TonB-dependent receptor-like protein n=1 Tax=Arenicella xantha TaxID=644221 RepID=A0A395JRT8_9GAMM|nr:TonB-dependent receptor [Arenicella xantha]RBP53295.1 TonB-dependent receptor-like protein [Arenicella xantha]
MNYKNPYRKSAIALAVSSATMMSAGMSNVAFAQDAETATALEEVIVTGSRIRRPDLASVTPVSVVSGEEFKISGNLNVEQKLAELPQTLPSFGPSSNNPGDGTARVDLRGLGTARTLVLVNGRRYIPATQTGVVDLNSIPGSLIKQVDVTTGGASAVYGSDALAGVVNFQLIDDFEGVEISGLYDVASEGDAEKVNIDLTMGGNFDDGRGNATVYTSFSKREAVYQGERDFSQFALTENSDNTALVPGGSSGIPGTRVFGGPTLPNGQTLGRFNTDGSGAPYTSSDAFNYAPDNFLQLPQERYLISAMAHYDLTESARLYSELAFSRNQVDSELAPTPWFTTLPVNPDSPFFAPDVQSALNGIRSDTNGDGVINGNDNATLSYIGRRMVEVGSRQSLDTRDGNRILVGLSGEINDVWSYDGYYSRSVLDRIQVQNGNISRSRSLQAALVTDDGLACQDPSNGCVPLNIFGEGNISAAAADFIRIGAINVTSITQEVWQGSVSGLVGSLPTTDQQIGVVAGLEYRKDFSRFQPDTALSSGDVAGFNAGNPTVGGFDVTELFTEIRVPLTDQVEAWGAYRYADYSNIGGVSSYATALSFAPTDKMRFRAGFQSAVRAPNVAELFSGGGNGFPGATDPCSADGFDPASTDAALCAATGVAASQVGVFSQANTQIQGLFGGNTNLSEEESDTFTLGAVFQPTENLDITVDYFDIQIENAISILGGSVNNVLDICYNQVKDINSAFCQAVTRRADGQVGIVNVLNENISSLETSGVDLNIGWTKDLDFGLGGEGSTLEINSKATYLLDFDVTPVAELAGTNECAGSFGNTCGSPLNELIVNTRVTWNTGPWGFTGLIRYLSAVDDDTIATQDANRADILVDKLDAEIYLDLAATYAFSDDFSVNFGVNNILDTEPTQIGDQQEQGNTFPSTYDLLGPRVFLSANFRFR